MLLGRVTLPDARPCQTHYDDSLPQPSGYSVPWIFLIDVNFLCYINYAQLAAVSHLAKLPHSNIEIGKFSWFSSPAL